MKSKERIRLEFDLRAYIETALEKGYDGIDAERVIEKVTLKILTDIREKRWSKRLKEGYYGDKRNTGRKNAGPLDVRKSQSYII